MQNDSLEFIPLNTAACRRVAKQIGCHFWKVLADAGLGDRAKILESNYPRDTDRQAYEAMLELKSSFEGSEEQKSKTLYWILEAEFSEASALLLKSPKPLARSDAPKPRPRSGAMDTATKSFRRRGWQTQSLRHTAPASMSKPAREQYRKRSQDDSVIHNQRFYNDISYFLHPQKSEKAMPKIFQSITREKGKDLLQGKARGTFLVRSREENYTQLYDEEGNPHMYTIVIEAEKEICNVGVFVNKETGETHCTTSGLRKKFPHLKDLLDWHRENFFSVYLSDKSCVILKLREQLSA